MLTGYRTNQSLVHASKPLGAYLVEAGLLNEAQVGVALADQDMTALPFGEIVVTRGWVKEQTIEYLMQKVILPERQSRQTLPPNLEPGLIRQRPKSTGQYPLPKTTGQYPVPTAQPPQPVPKSTGQYPVQAEQPRKPIPTEQQPRRTEISNRPINPRSTIPPEPQTADDEDGVNWIG